jgi:hypothetical protein
MLPPSPTVSILHRRFEVFAGLLMLACGHEEAIPVGQNHSEVEDAGVEENAEPMGFGGGRGPYYEEVDANYDALLATFTDYATFFCECEVGATSGAEFDACVLAGTATRPPPLLACTKEVISHNQLAVEALACELENNSTYIACIHEKTCFDFDHITGCETERIIRGLDCHDPPYEVWKSDQELCYGRSDIPPAFECLSGEKIDPALVCDLVDDCSDASDEATCTDPHAGLDLE